MVNLCDIILGSKRIKFILKSILVIAYIFCDAIAIAQNSQAIQVKKTVTYSTNDGLSVKCINEVFQDDRGRLWLNPCNNIGEELGINSFLFDGNQSHTFDFQFSEDSNLSSSHWMIKGQTVNSEFYGVNYDYDELVIWNQESDKTELYEIPETTLILALEPHPNGGILALLRTDEYFTLVHLALEGQTVWATIPKKKTIQRSGTFFSKFKYS